MRTIPQCREAVLDVADGLMLGEITRQEAADLLRGIEADMWRRPAIRKARAKRANPTPEKMREIAAYWEAHPELNQDEIGRKFGVSGARVSESVRGKRGEAV
jgi:5-formyltetrahydrofolate cyclo-ligase